MRWIILTLGISCALYSMLLTGCVNKYFMEQKELDEDTTIGSGVQYCELTDMTGKTKYFVFSNQRREDVCSEWR